MAQTPQVLAPDLDARIRRIYASINAIADPDLSKIRAISHGPGHFKLSFTLPAEELANLAHLAIHNVATLRDHLRGFARRQRRDPESVNMTIRKSLALRVILDLDEREKHGGGDRRDGGESGMNPQLGELTRGLSTMPPGVAMAHLAGLPLPSRLPPPRVVVDGPVLDSEGRRIGYLVELLEEAMSAWESLLRDLARVPGAGEQAGG